MTQCHLISQLSECSPFGKQQTCDVLLQQKPAAAIIGPVNDGHSISTHVYSRVSAVVEVRQTAVTQLDSDDAILVVDVECQSVH